MGIYGFMMMKKNFRNDINGLRAWAVVSVVLYHFGVMGFSGGFVGVDIFFVISGFLMMGIIVRGLEKSSLPDGQRFSVISFYLSRARRIIPALIVLCAFTLMIGGFFLSAYEYRALSVYVITALGFFSNFKFWRESGYFDAASHENLLLHTWSLSVEWQFYLILPVILLAVWKFRAGRVPLTILVVVGFLLSLLLSIILTPLKPNAAFYLLPARAWEMLAGGLVYLLANKKFKSPNKQRLIEGCGFALIIVSIALFDASSLWPGWCALVPVVGTMLVLISARQGSLWTGSRIAQWLGNCSYSLYLWHWPFVVAIVYLQRQNQPKAIAIGLILTLLSGWLSYRLIETPARTTLIKMKQLNAAIVLLIASLIVAIPSLFIQLQEGIPSRLPTQANVISHEVENVNPRRSECHVSNSTPVPECTYGGKQLGVIVIGDSHAASVIRSVEKALPSTKFHVLDWTLSDCRTIAGIKDPNNSAYRCGTFINEMLAKSLRLPKNVPLLIVNRTPFSAPNEPDGAHMLLMPPRYIHIAQEKWNDAFLQEMREGVIDTACEFAKTRPVYMLRYIPELIYNVPKTMGLSFLLEGESKRVSISLEEYHQRHAFGWKSQDMAAERCGVKILDPLPYLCHDGRCWGDVNGVPIYFDDDHLNERGGSLLIPLFQQIFKQPN